MTDRNLPRATAESQGMDSSGVLAFLDAVANAGLELHSLMIVRNGYVIAEGWWLPYSAERTHMLYSLSKSFTATAAGLAIGEGYFTLDDPVVSFFPEHAPAQISENLAAMRVRHLLSMSTGHDHDTAAPRDAATATEATANPFASWDWRRYFLHEPVAYKPGTHFVYNSGASYMVSAIVQKTTGLTLVDFLTPRLFGPLGIQNPVWETDPAGINVGGWGLNATTEDIAKFGQLYLQQGLWRGERILSESWIDQATAKQIDNGADPDSDWSQGYGYQFWRCRHGAYRGDGAFGQFCFVLPDKNSVIAVTSGVRDMQGVMNAVWETLLPAMTNTEIAEDKAVRAKLNDRLSTLTIEGPGGHPEPPPISAPVLGKTYLFPENEHGLQSAGLDFNDGLYTLRLVDGTGSHRIHCGANAWRHGQTAFWFSGNAPVAAAGAWTSASQFTVKLCFISTPFTVTLTYDFVMPYSLHLARKVNVAFAATDWPSITGVLSDSRE